MLALALSCLGVWPWPTPAAAQSRSAVSRGLSRQERDVVLIVIDTLRADHVGCFGYDRPTTPHIDALAARGVRFAKAFAQSSWTGPSMVSLFQSRHVLSPFVHMPEGPTLAERLREAGFRTAAFQYNPMLGPGSGYERGFDSYVMTADPELYGDPLELQDGRPLFTYFHFIDPHDPYSPIPEYDVFEPRRDLDLQARLAAYLRSLQPDTPADELEAQAAAAADAGARLVAKYDGDVLEADARVGMVIEALRESGRLARSLIVLTADHGECLGDHQQSPSAPREREQANPLWVFKMTHGDLVTEELLHVPLVIAGPGVAAGVVMEQPVENVDIVPTLLDLLGLDVPGSLDGRSLALQTRGVPGGRDYTYASTALFGSVRARDGRKLVMAWNPDGLDPSRAYRLDVDPRERAPLSPDDPAFADLAAQFDVLRSLGLRGRAEDLLIDDLTRSRLEALGYIGR